MSALVSRLDNECRRRPKRDPVHHSSNRLGFQWLLERHPNHLHESELALRAIAMPVCANAHGDTFVGWLLSQMDLAGSAVAVRRANGRVVTIAVTAMSFQRPVFVGWGAPR